MSKLTFKIRGMDCAEEVAILKSEVGPLVGGEENLSFDLINGKMSVENNGVTEDDVLKSVSKTGMRAVPWEQHLEEREQTSGWTWWRDHGRTVLCVVSGVALLAGFAYHAALHGFVDALGGHDEAHTHPLSVILLFCASIITGAWYIVPKAIYAGRRFRPDMNLLMTVAVIGAIGLGEWFEAAAVAFLFALALLLESWSVGRARKAISSLMDLSPTMARVYCSHDEAFEEKQVDEVAVGATVLVKPGEKVPLDGVVLKGATTINEAPITGESMPAEKFEGAEVFAGTLNNEGAFEFEVTKAADDTTLARIIHMVEEAQSRRAPSEQWVESFAKYYTPAMMFLAAAVAIVPPIVTGGNWTGWFYQALVILVIACPCALVISTPVSIVAGLTAAARAGVLIKGGVFLEAFARLKAIAIDKTGTLTHGVPMVRDVVPLNGHNQAELLERAAALEAHSEHPIARAVLKKAEQESIDVRPAENFRIVQGKGAEGQFNNKYFWLGSHRYLHEKGTETKECHEQAVALEDAGHSVVAIGNDNHVCGLISVADSLRDESRDVIAALKEAGVEHIVMITGDNEGTAAAVAKAIGLDDYRAEVLPEEKVRVVESLRREYGGVAMIGDGVNDAPALAASNLGIAMGAAGTDAAIETADIALMSDDLSKLPWLIRHSKRTLRIIKQNIFFALGLKVVFIVLAVFGLATLWMAIAADMGASLLVIFNGLRLLRQG